MGALSEENALQIVTCFGVLIYSFYVVLCFCLLSADAQGRGYPTGHQCSDDPYNGELSWCWLGVQTVCNACVRIVLGSASGHLVSMCVVF